MKLSILARNIKQYRIQAGLTQSELAKRMNVSQNAISSWETDRTEPNFEQAYKLCGILNIDLSTLTGTQPPKKTEITIADVYQKIKTIQDIDTLREIEVACHDREAYIIELEKIQSEKIALEKRMLQMQKRIEELENGNIRPNFGTVGAN